MFGPLLARSNVDVNAVDGTGRTPLCRAAAMGYPDTVRILPLHSSVDLNVQNRDGYTALVWAASRGHCAVVEYFCWNKRESTKTG